MPIKTSTKTYLLLSLTFIVFSLHLFITSSSAAVRAVVRVVLNTEDKGEHIVVLDLPDILFPVDGFNALGFKDAPVAVNVKGEKYISLASIRGLGFELDEKDAALVLTADPAILKKNIVRLPGSEPARAEMTRHSAAFLNYGVTYSAVDDFHFNGIAVPLEAGVSFNGMLAFSSFSYAKAGRSENLSRLLTNITADNVESRTRLIAGDFYGSSGSFGSSALLGGIGISKNFSLSPYYVKSPELKFSGFADTPSDVEVFMNNMLIWSGRTGAGEFEMQNLPAYEGAGNITVKVTDAYGREKWFTNPFYHSTRLLKPGLHEYSYGAGFMRKDFGIKSNEYDRPALMAFHRYGAGNAFTIGLGAEAYKNTVNLSPSAVFLIKRAGEVETSIAASDEDGKQGYGASIGYRYNTGGVNAGFTVRRLARNYANISVSAAQDKPKTEGTASAGYGSTTFGSMNIQYYRAEMHGGTDNSRLSLIYNRNIARDIALYATAAGSRISGAANREIFAGLNIFLGNYSSGSVSYRGYNGADSLRADFRKNLPSGTGLGYNLSYERGGSDATGWNTFGNGSLLYKGAYGIYAADYWRAGKSDMYNLGASGSLVYIGGSFYPARPVSDGFAVVTAGGIQGVKVYQSNLEVGETGKKGEIIVPDMLSYQDNHISIDDSNIPLDYNIGETVRYAAIPYRGGAIVKFRVFKTQGFKGRIFLAENHEKKAAEYARFEIHRPSGPVETFVGKDGEFYFEDMEPGKFEAVIYYKKAECGFDMTIPESDKVVVNLGDLVCGE